MKKKFRGWVFFEKNYIKNKIVNDLAENLHLRNRRSNRIYWSYNIAVHYKTIHGNIDPPNYISQDEIEMLKAFSV